LAKNNLQYFTISCIIALTKTTVIQKLIEELVCLLVLISFRSELIIDREQDFGIGLVTVNNIETTRLSTVSVGIRQLERGTVASDGAWEVVQEVPRLQLPCYSPFHSEGEIVLG